MDCSGKGRVLCNRIKLRRFSGRRSWWCGSDRPKCELSAEPNSRYPAGMDLTRTSLEELGALGVAPLWHDSSQPWRGMVIGVASAMALPDFEAFLGPGLRQTIEEAAANTADYARRNPSHHVTLRISPPDESEYDATLHANDCMWRTLASSPLAPVAFSRGHLVFMHGVLKLLCGAWLDVEVRGQVVLTEPIPPEAATVEVALTADDLRLSTGERLDFPPIRLILHLK